MFWKGTEGGVMLRRNLSESDSKDLILLSQNLGHSIDELEAKLDRILGE